MVKIQFNFLGLLIGIIIWLSLFSFKQLADAESVIDKTANYNKEFVNTGKNEHQIPGEIIAISDMIRLWEDKEYQRLLSLLDVSYTKYLFISSMGQSNIPIKDWTILETEDGFKVTYKIPDISYIIVALTNKDYQNEFYQLRDLGGGAWRKKDEKWHVKRKGSRFIINFNKKGIIPFFYTIGRNAGRNLSLEEKLQIIKNSYKKYYDLDDKDSSHVKSSKVLHVRFNTEPEGVCLEIDDEDYGLTPLNNIPLTEGYHNIKISLNNVIIVNENVEINKNGKEYLYKLPDLIASEKWNELVKINEPAVNKLINALKDNLPDDKLSIVAMVLGKIGNNRAVVPLINLLSNDSGEVRMSAINALGEIGDIRALEPIREVAKRDNDPDVSRVAFVVFVNMMKSSRDYKEIEKIVHEINNEIRSGNLEKFFQYITYENGNSHLESFYYYRSHLESFYRKTQFKNSSFDSIKIEIDRDYANVSYFWNFDFKWSDYPEIEFQNNCMVSLNLKKENISWEISDAKVVLNDFQYKMEDKSKSNRAMESFENKKDLKQQADKKSIPKRNHPIVEQKYTIMDWDFWTTR